MSVFHFVALSTARPIALIQHIQPIGIRTLYISAANTKLV